MNPPTDNLNEQLRSSPRPLPRADLAAQIIRQATAQPQRLGWQRVLAEFSYGWHYKLASLVLFGLLGLFAGQWQGSPDDSEWLVSAQILDSALYVEEP